MHYAGIAVVTDYDTGVEDDPGIEAVTMEQVLAVMEDNVGPVLGSSTSCCRTCPSTRPRATAWKHSAPSPTPDSGRSADGQLRAARDSGAVHYAGEDGREQDRVPA